MDRAQKAESIESLKSVFADAGRPGDWIGSFVGPHDYGIVIRAIESFDRLARSSYADIRPRALLPDRVSVRQKQWNAAVEQLLLDTLREGHDDQCSEPQPVPAGA